MNIKNEKFNNYELEIAILTYNRASFIQEWLQYSYSECLNRNIIISIYDSSTNDDTKNIVKEFNSNTKVPINYIGLPPETILGYKPMIPILNSKSKYVWISGDSRRHDFQELDDKVFPYIKADYDYILISANDKRECKDYTTKDLGTFIKECFLSSTCIGYSIYKTKIFSYLKENRNEKQKLDDLFYYNYGFGWLGYFYNSFAKGEHKARICKVKIIDILKRRKKQVWVKKFFNCWIDDMCQIIDNIPDCYYEKKDIPKIVWNELNLCSDTYLYKGRKHGDLNKYSYKKYVLNGLLDRVVQKKALFSFYANAPIIFVEIKYRLYLLYVFPKKLFMFIKKRINKNIK